MLGRAAFLAVLLAPAAARAAGPEFSLRLGPSFAAGSTGSGHSVTDEIGPVPFSFMLDGGYRINDRLYVGGFWAQGFGFVKPAPCPVDYDCDSPGLIANLGGGARYHLLPPATLDPWIGAGLAFTVEGYKGTRREMTGPCILDFGCPHDDYASSVLRFGASLLAEGGADLRLNERVALGLAGAVFAGKFLADDSTYEKNDDTKSVSSHGIDGGFHVWILTSARLVITLQRSSK